MRIIHISDLHFGAHNTTIIAPFLKDLALLKPDLIIISGDLTQRAKIEQYQLLQSFLKGLPAPFLAVPGNHDIPFHNFFSRFFQSFKYYKKFVSPSLEVKFQDQNVNILGVNSAVPYKLKDGELSKATISRIKNYFSTTSGQLNILFFHHNLNYFSGMHHPLNNAEEFIGYLQDSPIHIVCTGHLHYANVKLVPKNQHGKCAILHAGSLMCPRSKDNLNSFYVIDTNQLQCIIEWKVFNQHSFITQQTYDLDFGKE